MTPQVFRVGATAVLLFALGIGACVPRRALNARSLGLRRAQVSGRFQALRVGQPRRPERRPPVDDRACGAHHLRQLQRLHPEGRPGPGARPAVRQPDDACTRRARCRLRPGRSLRRAGARPPLGDVSHAPRGQVRRRQRAHVGRRHLHLRHPENQGPPQHPRGHQGHNRRSGARRRTASASTSPRQPAICPSLQRACRSCPRPTTQRASSTRPPSTLRWAPAPTRSATTGRARSSPTSAATTTGARTCPVMRGRFNFDEVRYVYYRDRAAELLALQAGEFDLREEFTAVAWVTGYDVPAVRSGQLRRLTMPDREPVGRAGLLPQHPPAEVRRRACAPGAGLRVRLRVRQQDHLPRSLHAHRELLRELGDEGYRQAERGGARLCSSRSATSCRQRSSPNPTGRRFGRLRQGSQAAAGGNQLFNEAGWTIKNGTRVNAKGEVLDIEFIIVDPTSERVLSNYVANLAEPRHRRPPSAASTQPSTSAASSPSTSTLSPPATACA